MATSTASRKRQARSKPLSDRLRAVYRLWATRFDEHELLTCATSISFKVIVSSITLLLLGLGVLGALGREDVWRTQIAGHVQRRVLPDVYLGINQTVEHIFTHDTTGLIAFACVLAVWQFSGAVRAAMNGLSHIYEEDDERSAPHRWLVSVALAIAIVAALLAAILLVVAAGGAVNGALAAPWAIVRWLLAILLVGLAFGLLVRYGPEHKRSTTWTSVGSALVVGGWLLEALAFRWYLGTLADFKSAVGSLTILLVVTAYFYIAAIILLAAIELDEMLRDEAAKRTLLDLFRFS